MPTSDEAITANGANGAPKSRAKAAKKKPPKFQFPTFAADNALLRAVLQHKACLPDLDDDEKASRWTAVTNTLKEVLCDVPGISNLTPTAAEDRFLGLQRDQLLKEIIGQMEEVKMKKKEEKEKKLLEKLQRSKERKAKADQKIAKAEKTKAAAVGLVQAEHGAVDTQREDRALAVGESDRKADDAESLHKPTATAQTLKRPYSEVDPEDEILGKQEFLRRWIKEQTAQEEKRRAVQLEETRRKEDREKLQAEIQAMMEKIMKTLEMLRKQ
ncbi:hypothetical protein HDU96_004321 [Phlyctochytrium bullatum]|nr:hypothetical protein HDU96_004321 [Phlyctochytrium bullatum]